MSTYLTKIAESIPRTIETADSCRKGIYGIDAIVTRFTSMRWADRMYTTRIIAKMRASVSNYYAIFLFKGEIDEG